MSGPEYPVAHGPGAGDQGKMCPKPEKSFRENMMTCKSDMPPPRVSMPTRCRSRRPCAPTRAGKPPLSRPASAVRWRAARPKFNFLRIVIWKFFCSIAPDLKLSRPTALSPASYLRPVPRMRRKGTILQKRGESPEYSALTQPSTQFRELAASPKFLYRA